MRTTELKLYRLELGDVRTWLAAAAFVAGNIILPPLLHLLPGGGVRFLPIYFFTLVGAYKYGWRAGLLTALISPMLNSLLFGMPAVGALPVILCKSTLLALVVIFYQSLGSLFEWAWTGSAAAALQDVRIGAWGMALQVVAGWAVIRYLLRK